MTIVNHPSQGFPLLAAHKPFSSIRARICFEFSRPTQTGRKGSSCSGNRNKTCHSARTWPEPEAWDLVLPST